MAFLKFKGDKIFDGYGFTEGKVLITDDKGIIIDLVDENEAGEQISKFEGILSPGFINCHCHLELSHLKGWIPQQTGLVEFVYNVVTQRHSGENQIIEAIETAEQEMIAGGIVGVGDICNNTLSIPQKNKGRICYHNFIEASGFDPSIAEQRFMRSLQIYTEYVTQYNITSGNSIVPHAPYSVSPELWERIIQFPGNRLMTIHNQETEGENEWFTNKQGEMVDLFFQMRMNTSHFIPSGSTSLQTFLGRFLPNQSLILVHNVHTNREDIIFSRSSMIADRIFWCLCPNANWYISRMLPPLNLFLEEDCTIVLGTDSLASNLQLSIMHEIKTLLKHFPHLSLETCLKWATINGAKALHMEGELGSFEKGKKPGVIIIENNNSVKRLI